MVGQKVGLRFSPADHQNLGLSQPYALITRMG
jgi:hypothetical protein